jgi:hypothetical protein
MFWLSLDVYGGNKTGYKREIPKDPIYYMRQGPVMDIVSGRSASLPWFDTILIEYLWQSSASSADHSWLRCRLAPLFSQRAVTLQEKYLRQYIALFIARLA